MLYHLFSVILFSVIGNFRLIVKNKRKEIQNSQSNKARNKNCMILTCWVHFFEQREEEVTSVVHTIDPEKPQGWEWCRNWRLSSQPTSGNRSFCLEGPLGTIVPNFTSSCLWPSIWQVAEGRGPPPSVPVSPLGHLPREQLRAGSSFPSWVLPHSRVLKDRC